VGGRAKRAVDLAVAVPLAIATAPIMAGVAAWIRRDSPGSPIFRQERIGYGGNPFTLFKFRTMRTRSEHAGTGHRVGATDTRVTRAGRVLRATSLDELPQLWNVLRGDMSIVGPRPTVAWQVTQYSPHERRRLLARPGITGLAQVRGRNSIPWSRRIEIDIEYVEHWSLRLDLEILAKTLKVILARRDTHTEAPAFDLGRPPTG
jgi:lipopolysaccharide/colanic/teichoic acid biosynthesis glycosyltransferase